MAITVASTAQAMERKSLADVCGKPVKAALAPQLPATDLRRDAAEAMRRVSSQKSAAITIGLDEGRLSHKNSDGTLTLAQLEKLGPDYAAELGKSLVEKYAPLAASPLEQIEKRLDEIQALVNEVRQGVRHVAA